MPLMLLKLAFKPLEQGKSVGCAARKSRENLVMVEPAHLASAGLGYNGAQGYLAIAPERHLLAAPRRKYGGTAKFWHVLAQNE
jgi:hypothetical protein